MFDKIFQKIWLVEWLEKNLRYLSDFFSAIVKCIWKKIFEKSVDLITPVLIKQPPYKKNGKKSLQCLWPPKLTVCHSSSFCTKLICNLFTTSESPKYSNSNSPNLLLWFFCLIKSWANPYGITQPFLNLNLIFASNCLLQIH